MAGVAIAKESLDELRRLHVAFLERRLLGDGAAREWRDNVERCGNALLTRPVGELVTESGVLAAMDAVLTQDSLARGLAPLMSAANGYVFDAIRREATRVGDHVPPEARARIDVVLQRPQLMPESLVRQVLEHEALEEAMRDVLYDALKAFNDTVNPFFADWGLPALVRRLMPIGSGPILKSLETVRGEFDKRLEPELRKFLLGASKRALRKLADVVVRSSDDPKKGVAVRKAVAAWLYEQKLRDLIGPEEGSARTEIEAIGLAIAQHSVALEVSKAQRLAAVEAFFAAHASKPAGEVLAQLGIDAPIDFDAVAQATWPFVRAALDSPPARAWVAACTHDFYDEVSS